MIYTVKNAQLKYVAQHVQVQIYRPSLVRNNPPLHTIYYITLKLMTDLPGSSSYIASQGDFKQCFPLTKIFLKI